MLPQHVAPVRCFVPAAYVDLEQTRLSHHLISRPAD